MNNRLINTKVAGGGCTDIVDNYDPFDGNGVALYQLNGNATDVSGNYDGTATSVTYGAGEFGQAGVFNGSSSEINLNSAVLPSSVFSVSMWFNLNTINRTNYLITQYILAGGSNGRFEFAVDSTNNFVIYLEGGALTFTTSVSLSANTWYNVVLIKNGASGWACYLDGQSLGTNSDTRNIYTGDNTRLGKRVGLSSGVLDGSLDQVRIFNTALTPLEVEALYTEELCICDGTVDTLQVLGDTSCIATYQLDGNANDLSGNYSGQATNVSYGVGEFDLAGVFNGSTSGINLGNGLVSSLTALSTSIWFNTDNISLNAQILLDLGFSSTGNGLQIYIGSVGNIIYRVNSGGSTVFQEVISGVISNNTWYNITATFENTASGAYKLYLNNSLIASGNSSQTGSISFASTGLYLGHYNQTFSRFNGSIDQVRIFNKALNSTEVETLWLESACTYGGRQSEGTQILGDTSCIAYYKLDGTADDETGTYDGTFTTPNYGNGEFLYAGVFNGTSSFIDTNAKIPASLNFSVSFWMKSSDTSSGGYIFGTKGNYLTNGWLITNDAGYIRYGEGNGVDNATFQTSPSIVADGSWKHIVVTRAAGGTINMYVNNSRVITDGSVGTYFMTSSTWANDLHIGRYSGSSILFYDGELDQIRIFNKAVSSSEVTTLYNEGI